MEKGESKRWTTLKSEYLVKRPWLTARRDMVQLPNGVINDEYYVLEYPDWVNVIAITADGQFVFVRQYRYGLGIDSVELCAGVAEPGETPEQALARECREELALEIENERIIDSVVHEYPEKTIRLTLISCTPKAGSEPAALEHQQIRWVTRAEMDSLPFCPADADLIKTLSL